MQTEVTAPAISEMLSLLEGATATPFEEGELREARDYQVGVFPLRFETTGGIASAIEPIAIYGLADNFWQTYRDKIEAVGAAEAHAAASELIRPAELLIMAVGDASLIRDDVAALGVGSVEEVAGP